jgi:hypothetical protein
VDTEKKMVKLQFFRSDIREVDLFIYDNIEGDEDSVILEVDINGKKFEGHGDNCFDALKELRKCLEKEEIQIMCNGAGRNVYPSAMQFDFGNTRKAYKKHLGIQAKMSDLVDILDYSEDVEFVSIDEQLHFENEWFESF